VQTPEVAAPAVVRNKPELMLCPYEAPAVSRLSIRYGRFSVELNETTDERLLSMAALLW